MDEHEKIILEIGFSHRRARERASALRAALKRRGIDLEEEVTETEVIKDVFEPLNEYLGGK